MSSPTDSHAMATESSTITDKVKAEPETDEKMVEAPKSSDCSTLPHQDPDFQVAIERGIQIARTILEVYKNAPRKVSQIMLEEANGLARHPKPNERIIGLVGPSGAGKSSLINSLLEDDGLAIVDGSGHAVTCFPVHYRYSEEDSWSKYTVECYFPTQDELRKQLCTLLDDLCKPQLLSLNDVSAEDYQSCEEAARAAEDIFNAAFKDMDEYDIRLLYDIQRRSEAESLLSHLASELPWPEDLEDGVWTRSAESVDETQETLEIIRDDGLWPFVRSLTIYSQAPLLNNGVVLVDLPGYHDSNYARVKIARQTQSKCDDLFVVGDIKRAIDSPTLLSVIEENLARPELGELTLQTITAVCTHSASGLDAKLEKLADKGKLKPAKDALTSLKKSKTSSWTSVEAAKYQYNKLLIEGRNDKVCREMAERYQDKLPEGNFKVFCVDNVMYTNSTATEGAAEASGIPQLQEFICHLPACTLFKLYDNLLGNLLPALVASYETWVRASRTNITEDNKVKAAIPSAHLPGPEALRKFHHKLNTWTKDMAKLLRDKTDQPLVAAASIVQSALEIAEGWTSIHAGTFGAILRRDGVFVNSRKERFDFNEDLNHYAGLVDLRNSIIQAFEEYPKQCEKLGAPTAFLECIKARHNALDHVATSAKDDFKKQYGVIKRNANVSQEESYVRNWMHPAYREAFAITGRGSKAERHSILQTHIDDPSLVSDFCQSVAAATDELISATSKDLLRNIQSTTNAIQQDLDNFQGEQGKVPLFELHPAFGAKAEAVLEEVRFEMQRISELAVAARERARVLYAEPGGDKLSAL